MAWRKILHVLPYVPENLRVRKNPTRQTWCGAHIKFDWYSPIFFRSFFGVFQEIIPVSGWCTNKGAKYEDARSTKHRMLIKQSSNQACIYGLHAAHRSAVNYSANWIPSEHLKKKPKAPTGNHAHWDGASFPQSSAKLVVARTAGTSDAHRVDAE